LVDSDAGTFLFYQTARAIARSFFHFGAIFSYFAVAQLERRREITGRRRKRSGKEGRLASCGGGEIAI
jgi:hypothetical protein